MAHRDETHQNGHWQGARYQDRRLEVEQHENDYDDRDQDLQAQRLFQGANGFVDQLAAIIEGNDLNLRNRTVVQHFAGEARLQFGNPGFHIVDHL